MAKVTLYDAFTNVSTIQKSRIVAFLNKHLDDGKTEQTDIECALDYAVKDVPSFGGFIVKVEDDAGEIIGSTIVTKTGMKGEIYGDALDSLGSTTIFACTREPKSGFDNLVKSAFFISYWSES